MNTFFYQSWWFLYAVVPGLLLLILFFINRHIKIYKIKLEEDKEKTANLLKEQAILKGENKELSGLVEEMKAISEELEYKNEELEEQKEEVQAIFDEISYKNQELERQKEELSTLYKNSQLLSDFGQKITSTLKIEAIHSLTYEYVSSLIKVSAFGIGLYNDKKKSLVFPHFFDKDGKVSQFEKLLSAEDCLTVWSFKEQKTVYTNDLQKDFNQFFLDKTETVIEEKPKSIILIPLTVEEKRIGIVALYNHEKDTFEERDFVNLKSLASYISIALDNANAYEIVSRQNIKIRDSINSAKAIQNAILPSSENLHAAFDHFIIFRPKDIVSGDFYWFTSVKREGASPIYFIAVVDCTGHGVPGAFMSMIGSRVLNEIVGVTKIYDPKEILNQLNESVIQALRQDENKNDDGMDVCLCRIEKNSDDKYLVNFSGAKRPLIYSHKNELTQVKGSLKGIGGFYSDELEFTEFSTVLEKGDSIFLTSDGYADQPNVERKTMGVKLLMSYISKTLQLSSKGQKVTLENYLDTFQRKEAQRDDISILGIRL